ncbi:peptidyl-prolyl cis-trans isomerase CYP21-4-like [Solanum dulcamara]|uniref:peptidyl-prolyl cis-trans isomerase CYP21-4-like n=1 Tax=Solanum dulcamara TaxID=45834 RepID=UPI002485D126|nr:peptidyl-prolyl cis-trans isomerase CYP21-4-like [Solanum dulcamara]XP_055812153.1 peptidyl-prolyl cis-trans isomerase CYP21-4-like [Solanum dulcamara]
MGKIKPQALLLQSKKKKGPSGISVPTIMLYGLIVSVMVFFVFATYRHWSRRSMIQTQDDLSTTEGENTFIEHKRSDVDGPAYALITTSKGLITVELYKDGSPDIVDEFVDFCQKGHFKGMRFNRVIKHFVIHGSKVDKSEGTEDWTSRGKHYSRLDTSLKHEAFMLGTSKTKHESGGFDLFITTAPIPDLNDKINVFGRVIKGEDIVQEIEEVDTDDHYRPKTPVQINELTLKYST